MKKPEVPTVLLMRHDKTKLNQDPSKDIIKGKKIDPPLDEQGKADAEKVGAKLGKWDVASIEHSSMKRTTETAGILAKHAGVKAKVNTSLDPWDTGYLAGHKRLDAESRIEYYIKHPKRTVPEGEPYDSYYDPFTDELSGAMAKAKRDPERLHIRVTHSDGLMAADAFINHKDPRPHTGELPPPGSATAIERRGGRWNIRHDFPI